MDHGFPSEQLSIPYNPTYAFSDTEEDYLADQSQAEFYPDNLQINVTEVSSIPPSPYYQDESPSVVNTPNDQSQFYTQPQLPSNDFSQTEDRIIGPLFEGRLIDNDTRHLASVGVHRAAGWRSTTFRTAQEGTVEDLEAQGVSGSDPAGSSYSTIGDTLYSQYRMQDDNIRTTSSFRQLEGTSQSHAVAPTRGQDAAKQEALRLRKLRKKEKDRIRKEGDRTADDEAYLRVCNLLAVKSKPKNTRSKRILKGIESIDQDFERMCELLEISMTPRKTLAHRILERIEAMAERQKVDRDLRCRLKEREVQLAFLTVDTFQDTGSGLPVNYTAVDDTGRSDPAFLVQREEI